MTRSIGYFLSLYLAYCWQAALRPELAWNGLTPNFLAVALIGSCIILRDNSALLAATVIGLLSDSLTPTGFGPHVLCYLILCITLQGLCPPKFVRNQLILLGILLLTTSLLEFSGEAVRATLHHELDWSSPQSGSTLLHWAMISLGNGLYTAALATVPLLLTRGITTRLQSDAKTSMGNHWHRLTSG